MKTKIITKLIITIILILMTIPTITYSYWSSDILGSTDNTNASVQIGTWTWIEDDVTNGYDLNIWEDEDTLNQNVSKDTLFSYNDLLYITIKRYNPYYNDLPDTGSNQWAYVSVDLEWRPDSNYRVNSVVVRNGIYYIANVVYNKKDWFVNDPLDSTNQPWSEWRKISPLPESYFGYLVDYPTVRDYRADINDVIYI